MRNFELPGRSPMHGMNGMAATSHPLATLAAINVLQGGGNAIDAAVAACAVQCVVEPASTGIGGDCFVLYAPAGGNVIAFNGSGRAPALATPEWYAEKGITEIERTSPHAVTVPGAVDAWARLIEDHGTMNLGALLRPAIAFARDGFPISSRVAHDWVANVDHLSHDPGTAGKYLPGGHPPAVGSVLRLPALAATLERIAEHGRAGFYAGPVAEDIVSHLNTLGGLQSMDDFAAAKGEYVEPIHTDYGGYTVHECPPNGQGIAALEMLNILAGFDLAALDPLSAERLHLEIEAKRLAYGDRDSLIADPAQVPVPVDHLLSQDHATALRSRISFESTMETVPPSLLPAHADTIYLCVVDRDNNAVSFINSLFNGFGTGLSSPESGVLLQNRGYGFVLEAGHPNCIAPNKRPLHTIIPGMLAKNGRAIMPFGVMGGHYQAMGHTHFLTNVIDYGLDLQEAIDLPRVFAPQQGPVEVESGVPHATVEGLRRLGHETTTPAKPIGGGQAIWIDWDKGVLTGASDPRKDGCALGI
ncbi:MAG: gamma-glutamyltransferase [Rhodospirillales bacterium]|nr:gamma-glutamyltransferase [Rhodospirillales bacterium]